MMSRIVAALGLALALPCLSSAVDFEKDVHPILTRSCLGCHSAALASGGLRLDSRAGAEQALSGKLIQRVSGTGTGPRMPLGTKPLSDEQIATLKKWIDEGAPWPEASASAKHWAYVKPVRTPMPTVREATWIRNPIDAFVLARLEREGLAHAPQASQETLIRRVTIDLTGLPPTLDEIDAFLADSHTDAYERLVDRLLASPHFGERWARPWLDLARYADTNGLEKDRRRNMWKYRDWVIQAFNQDLPFDQFTIAQIAGDMLPKPTNDQLIATGFHRNTMFNEEGGVDKDEAFWESLVDRVSTTSTVWLGSTLGCAQCHDHKFDPFKQKEFYQMMAFFNNGEKVVEDYGDTSQKYIEPQLDLPTSSQEGQRLKLLAEIKAIEAKIKSAALSKEQAEWEQSIRAARSSWTPIIPASLAARNGAVLTAQTDASILVSGANSNSEVYTIEARLNAARITGIRLEALPDPSLPRSGPGRDVYGNFFLKDVQVEGMKTREAMSDDGPVRFRKATEQLWSLDASRDDQRLPRQLILLAGEPFDSTGNRPLRITIRQESEFGGQSLGHFRLSYTTGSDPTIIATVSAKMRPILEKQSRTDAEEKQLADFYRGRATSLKADRDRLKDLRKEMDNLGIASALILRERATTDRPSAEIRLRGQFLSKGDVVYAAVPAFLPPLPEGEPVNRLALARWLVSKENPLTARVLVNRIWEQYFGRGIVETSEDFGTQGDRPTHPELLDWLALELMDHGWSMKSIHRLIVTSATYRQASPATPQLLDKDPYNKLLARGPRFRMEAEMIRDVDLSASGLLSLKIGGPSVFPPQPEGVWDLPYNDDKWIESKGDDRYRRALYTFIRRTAPYPTLLTFDGSSREFCTVRRLRTNTPLQALTTLNDPAFFEAAQALARRLKAQGGRDSKEQAAYAFRLCTGRRPQPAELNRITSGFEKERAYFAEHPQEAKRASGGGDPTLAAWTIVSNALLNLDETITKE